MSYDSDHGLTQDDIDMVNSLVEVIESTRSKHTPKIGDRVVYTQKGGEYHPNGLIEKKHENKFYVCLDPFIPFVWESDTAIKVDISGGPFYHADAGKFKFIGWAKADFKEWGHCGASAKEYADFVYNEYRWKGRNYQGQHTPEIVELVRNWIKDTYPKYKFSVSRHHYNSIHIYLVKADFEAFKKDKGVVFHHDVNHYHIDNDTPLPTEPKR